MSNYEKKLAEYERRLKEQGGEEGSITEKGSFGESSPRTGFLVDVYEKEVAFYRPLPPEPRAWAYSGYDRSFGFTSHAEQLGVLAGPLFNRDIRPDRVEKFQEEMRAGRWHDLLSDPITVTKDGQVVNGQHRLAAAGCVDWDEVGNDPVFLVVWGVAPEEALFADGSRRTARDEKMIASRILAGSKEEA